MVNYEKEGSNILNNAYGSDSFFIKEIAGREQLNQESIVVSEWKYVLQKKEGIVSGSFFKIAIRKIGTYLLVYFLIYLLVALAFVK